MSQVKLSSKIANLKEEAYITIKLGIVNMHYDMHTFTDATISLADLFSPSDSCASVDNCDQNNSLKKMKKS